MVHVAGFGQANDRMQEKRAVDFFDDAFRQFFMDTVQGVARLECDDVLVAHLGEEGTGLCRRQARFAEIVVGRQLEHAQASGYVDAAQAVHFRYHGMAQVLRAKDFL